MAWTTIRIIKSGHFIIPKLTNNTRIIVVSSNVYIESLHSISGIEFYIELIDCENISINNLVLNIPKMPCFRIENSNQIWFENIQIKNYSNDKIFNITNSKNIYNSKICIDKTSIFKNNANE